MVQARRIFDRDVNSAGCIRYVLEHYMIYAGNKPEWNNGPHDVGVPQDNWQAYQAPDPNHPQTFVRMGANAANDDEIGDGDGE